LVSKALILSYQPLEPFFIPLFQCHSTIDNCFGIFVRSLFIGIQSLELFALESVSQGCSPSKFRGMTSFNILFQPWGESLNFIVQVFPPGFCIRNLHFYISKLTDNTPSLGITTVYSGFRGKKLSCTLYIEIYIAINLI
jgi:hypothetical protein